MASNTSSEKQEDFPDLSSLFPTSNPIADELKSLQLRAKRTHRPPFKDLPESERTESVYHGYDKFKRWVQDFAMAIKYPEGWSGLAEPARNILLIGRKGVGKSTLVGI